MYKQAPTPTKKHNPPIDSILKHKLLTTSGKRTKYALQQGYIQLPKKNYPDTYIYLSWGYGCFIIQGYKNEKRVYKELETVSIVEARKILEQSASKLDKSPASTPTPAPVPRTKSISRILHNRF